MTNNHYELKKIYYGLLANDPDYPAWQDFEYKANGEWKRFISVFSFIDFMEYRYNPLPKKWEPKNGGCKREFLVSSTLTKTDFDKIQRYATKISWLRENGGYKFKEDGDTKNYYHYTDKGNHYSYKCESPSHEEIYMNYEQAKKWLDMLNNGEV